ncbi:MAG: hypothetical protein ABW133_14485, partial [Polyangiaceae bacterium]
MKALSSRDPLGIVEWLTVGMLASALGCSVYDEGLLPVRDPVGAGGSSAGAGGSFVDASSDRGGSGGASAGSGGAGGTAGSGAAGAGGSTGGAAGSGTGGVGGANPDASDAPLDQLGDRTIDVTIDASGRDGVSVDAWVDAPLDAIGPGVDSPAQDANTRDTDVVDAGVVDAGSDGGPVVGLTYNIVAKHSGKCMTI